MNTKADVCLPGTLDCELLKLAAKAAGLKDLTEWSDEITDHDSAHYGEPALHEGGVGGQCSSWNPLLNNEDAFRLAVTLRMNVYTSLDMCVVEVRSGGDVIVIREPWNGPKNRMIVTRRAIVRAAARVGLSCKE